MLLTEQPQSPRFALRKASFPVGSELGLLVLAKGFLWKLTPTFQQAALSSACSREKPSKGCSLRHKEVKGQQDVQLARKAKMFSSHLLLLPQGVLVTTSLSLVVSADLCQSL